MPLFRPPSMSKLEAKGDLDGLIKALANTRYPQTRIEAAQALGRLKDPRAVTPLIALFADSEKSVCLAAIEALKNIGEPALPALIRVFQEAGEPQHTCGLVALADLNWNPEPGVLAAQYWIERQDWTRCASLGAVAVKPLVTLYQKTHLAVAAQALRAITDEQAIEPLLSELVAAIKARDTALCSAVAEALKGMGRPGIQALAGLLLQSETSLYTLSLLHDMKDPASIAPVRRFLEHRVKQMQKRGPGEFDAAIKRDDQIARAIAVLKAIGGPEASTALEQYDQVVHEARAALEQSNQAAQKDRMYAAIQTLKKVVVSSHQTVSYGGRSLTVPRDNESTYQERDEARSVLEKAGTAAVEPLLALLGELEPMKSEQQRRAKSDVAEILCDIGDSRAAEPVLMVLEQGIWWFDMGKRFMKLQPSEPLVERAVRAIIAKANEAFTPRIDCDGVEYAGPRLSAAEALAALGGSQAVDALMDWLQTDSDYQIRAECAKSLGIIGDPRAIDALTRAKTTDEDQRYVRRAAETALQRLGVT